MKTSYRIHSKFMVIFLLGGCVIGALVPLSRSGGKGGDRAGQPVVRPAISTSRVTMEMSIPDVPTAEWAAECAATQPDKFLRWMLKADPQPSHEVVMAFFAAWISVDPDSAFQSALLLPSRFGVHANYSFFGSQLRGVYYRDPMCALRWASRIDGLLGTHPVMNVSNDVFNTMTHPDSEEIRSLLGRGPINGTSAMIAKGYAAFLASTDVEAAVRWGESLPVEYQNAVLPMMLYKLAKKDPEGALKYIESAPSNVRQYAAFFALGSSSRPVSEDMRWIEEEMGVTSYMSGLCSLMERYVSQNPKAAENFVFSLDDPAQRTEAMRGLAQIYCRDTDKAVSWIVALPDDFKLEAAHAAMVDKMPGSFTSFAKPLVDGSLSGENLEGYTRMLAGFMAGEKITRPDGVLTTRTIADFGESLENFQSWVQDHPGPGRDRLIQVAYEVLEDNPVLRKQVFSKLEPNELSRILEAR